jgi:hypothetical protein
MSPGNPVGLGNTRISTEYARKSPWTLSWSRLADFKICAVIKISEGNRLDWLQWTDRTRHH